MKIAVKLPGQAMFGEEVNDTYEGIEKHIPGMLDHGVLRFRYYRSLGRTVSVDFFCDDEGMLKNLEPNFPWNHGPPLGWQVICGPVVFVGPTDENGDSTEISDEQVETLEFFFNSIRPNWVQWMRERMPDAFEPKIVFESLGLDDFIKRMGG